MKVSLIFVAETASDSALLDELWIDSVLYLMRSSIGNFKVSVATDPSLNLKLTKLSVDEV